MTTTATSIAASVDTASRGWETNAGIVTSWLPLTTAYPSVSGCADHFYSFAPNVLAGWDPGFGLNVNPGLKCQPSQVTSWWNFQPPLFVYSIGPIVCPEAYTTGFTSIKDPSSTFVACCPSGYSIYTTLGSGETGECFTQLTPGQVVTYGASKDDGWTTTSQTITQVTTAAGIQVNGWIFAQETSISKITTPISTPISTSTTSNTISTSTCQTNNNTVTSASQSSTDMSNSRLSIATDVGIGIGVSLAILVVACLTLFLFWRRLHRRSATQSASIRPDQRSPKELEGFTRRRLSNRKDPETGNTEASELPADTHLRPTREYHELWTAAR